MNQPASPWWKGARGEWYVVVQIALFALVAFGPRTLPGWPSWTGALGAGATVVGMLLMAAGGVLLLVALRGLGEQLTPLPYPKEDGELVRTGAYRLVRHPMYCSAVLVAVGWGLLAHGLLTLGYAGALFLFCDLKSSREERWLRAKYPEYAAYQQRVRKLIPWVY
jgi:protein-S-isoprenylcysteine O-methyltransferase Ste14